MNLVTASRDQKGPSSVVLITSTTPSASTSLHETLKAGQAVRSCAAVHFKGPARAPVFGDIRSVPAAVPPLPNAGGVRGGRPSYAAKQGGADFMFDYGLAFSLRPGGAFARGGFGSTCIGRTCGGKGTVYARGSEPFVWERKRNRGGALICRGGGGHLLCLRCVEAEYEAGRPFVSSATGGPVPQRELFTKYEAFDGTKELWEIRSGEEARDGGYQFFVQRRDLAPCLHCREPKAAALSRRGVKRALEQGASPRELGTAALLSELHRSKIPPIAVAPGLFLLPQLDASSGRLLEVSATGRSLSNVPRLVKVDHMGSFRCLCGQKACRDHDMRFLEATRLMSGWWQGGAAIFTAFDDSRPFAREVTSGVPWVLPWEQGGCLGSALFGLDAEAWKGGPHLRVFVVSDPGEEPVVCVLGGEGAHCSSINCTGPERCRHLLSVLLKQTMPLIERAIDGGRSKATRIVAERRAKRVAQREAGARRLLVCNDPICRRPDSKVVCTHRGTLEPWECLSAAALDMGHSHKKVDTIMSRGGASVTSLCDRWGEEGVRRRDKAKHFCAPRPVEVLAPCGRPWQVESKRGALTMAGARYEVTTYRRVCRITPGREAACCSVVYDGQEDGIFNFSGTTLLSHGLLLRNHFAAALGAAHSLNFEAGDMAARCLEGPGVSRLDDRVFDSAMQAFNDLAARVEIQHVCSRSDCAHLYTSEVEAAEAEARATGVPLKAERTEGLTSELATFAFGRDKVITFDGTFFANSSAMRDSTTEASLHSICEPDPEAPRVAGGFTPLSVGGVRPSQDGNRAPSDMLPEGIDCPWKYRNGLSELRPAVRALAQRWCNFRKAPAQGSNAPLKSEEFVMMREGLPANVVALIDFVTEAGACANPATCDVCQAVPRRPWMQGFLKEGPVGPTGWCPTHFQAYGALLHALLIPRYSWVFGRVVTLKLLRHLLLEGPLDARGMAYLSNDGPMLAAVLHLHPTAEGLHAFPKTLRPLVQDIYAMNLLCFEPSANRPSSHNSRSPLAALHDATEHLWTIEGERLRLMGQLEAAAMECAEQRGAILKRAANLVLFKLEVREPPCYEDGGFLRAPSTLYAEQAAAVSAYAFHPLLYGRPRFVDWEDEAGRGKKGSEERLTQHCSAPNPRSSKGRAGIFIACCQDRAPLGYHWLKGGESVSDLGTILLTRFPFKTLRGMTVVEDASCNAQEWMLNRVPQLAKFILFVVDRFHSGPISCAPLGAKRYATHMCAPTLFIDSFPQHERTITTASEGINSGLKRCAASLQQITSIKRLMSRVTTILDTLFERSKYAVFWREANSPLRDLIKRIRGC
ncbi:hypothetical protein KFL_001820040 [Klebsormidium nitens]|uniref:Uncharacterized protein n=1 Tax=Klebsormidium nitens TaxID=105231 RepID=A0A1Y1I512_KLENI|nr:hypothetical protein KFL_001820040 [Klebsormidium nitens]|eukprot:GAQ84251.1 hypothetical protein KFL_001820040 [Klebsormidium nitens]